MSTAGMGSIVSEDILGHLLPALAERDTPLILPWPLPGNPGGFQQFSTAAEWAGAVRGLGLDHRIPLPIRAKFTRALKILLLGWLDPDLIKASELVAFTALELALKDRLGAVVDHPNKFKPRTKSIRPETASLAALLDHLVTCEGLTDADLPTVARCGGSAVERLRLNSLVRPSLAELRNEGAHGHPYDGFPQGGLIELIRDIIHFAYRAYLAEAFLRHSVNVGQV